MCIKGYRESLLLTELIFFIFYSFREHSSPNSGTSFNLILKRVDEEMEEPISSIVVYRCA